VYLFVLFLIYVWILYCINCMLLFMGACMKMIVEKVTMGCEGESEVGIRREREENEWGREGER
jgi:hypothetical protein